MTLLRKYTSAQFTLFAVGSSLVSSRQSGKAGNDKKGTSWKNLKKLGPKAYEEHVKGAL